MTRGGAVAARAAVGLAVVLLAVDHAGYGAATRGAAALLAWWALLVFVVAGVWPREPLPPAALLAGALLASFAVFTGASALWADSAEAAFVEFARVSLYLGVFGLVIAARRGSAAVWIDGLGAGIAVVGLLAVLSRCLGFEQSADFRSLLPGTEARLSFPLGYWNGLGILLGIGVPLLMRAATDARSALARGAAVASLPALAVALYLTSSRGATAVALLGSVAFVLLSSRAVPAIAALAIGAVTSAIAIGAVEIGSDVAQGPVEGGEGVSALMVVLLCCAAAGAAHALVTSGGLARVRLSPLAARVMVGVGLAAALAGTIVLDPAERVEAFQRPPNELPTDRPDFVREHLLSGGGSGRWQFWNAALDQFEQHPIAGAGAGSFQAWWLAHGGIAFYVRDAHSLYFETLGELGLAGFALLAVGLGVGLVAGASRLRAACALRPAVAAAMAGFLGFLLGAALDWIWELTVVGIVGVACLGILCGPASEPERAPRASRPGFGRLARVGVAVAALLMAAGAAISWATAHELDASRAALARGDAATAAERASAAGAVQPWAASPHLQLALVYEYDGDLAAARGAIDDALRRESNNWQLWTVAARLDAESGRVRAAGARLRRARELHPYSPLFSGLDRRAKRALERALGGGQ